jgi:hypothetical protein
LGNKGTEGTAGVEPSGCVLEDNSGYTLNYFLLGNVLKKILI